MGSVVGSVAGGLISASASNKAAKTQAAAADRAAEVQKEMYEQTREDLTPYRTTGVAANNTLSQRMGLDTFDREKMLNDTRSKYKTLFGGGEQTPVSQPMNNGASITGGDRTMLQSFGLVGDPSLPRGNKFSSGYGTSSQYTGIDLEGYEAFNQQRLANKQPPLTPPEYMQAGQPKPNQKKLSSLMGAY